MLDQTTRIARSSGCVAEGHGHTHDRARSLGISRGSVKRVIPRGRHGRGATELARVKAEPQP